MSVILKGRESLNGHKMNVLPSMNFKQSLPSIAGKFAVIRRCSYAPLAHLHTATSTHRAEFSPQGIS